MRTSHLTIAFAFFCGFRAPAQTIAPLDSSSTAAPAKADTTVVRLEASNSSTKEEEGPPAVVAQPFVPPQAAQDSLPTKLAHDSLKLIPFNLGIAPGTSSNGKHPEHVRNYVSFDLVAGEAGEIKGLQASGAMNELHGPMKGMQVSAGLNRVEGDVTGYQGSTVNLVKGNVKGYQGAYVLNRVDGNVKGYQTSSFGNLVSGDLSGMQTSFYGNARTVRGLQFNGVSVADTLYGVQFGLVNVASDRMKGAQIGLVNVSGGGNGSQIGLVNVSPDTRIYAESWVDETKSVHLAMNYGGPNFYSLVEMFGSAEKPHARGLGLGFGARVASPKTILSVDQSLLALGSADESDVCSDNEDDNIECAANLLLRTRLTVGRHVVGRLAFFGGVSYNVLLTPEKTTGERLLEPVRSYHYDPNEHVRLWPGLFVGVRI